MLRHARARAVKPTHLPDVSTSTPLSRSVVPRGELRTVAGQHKACGGAPCEPSFVPLGTSCRSARSVPASAEPIKTATCKVCCWLLFGLNFCIRSPSGENVAAAC